MVPICFVVDGETLYSAIDDKPKRTTELKRLENLRAHPHAAVLVDVYREDWSRLWWVRLDAKGRVVAEGPERDRAIQLLVAKYHQYRRAEPGGAVIALDVYRWAGWSSSAVS
jgi:PPOX class probable F420-dependent enzyme